MKTNQTLPTPLVIETRGGDYLLTHSADGLRSILAHVKEWDICPEHDLTAAGVAQLIAAAPDLLTSLEALAQWVEDNAPTPGDPEGEWCDQLPHARAAIAKATGRRPLIARRATRGNA